MNTEAAILQLEKAFTTLRSTIAASQGELTAEIKLSGRMDSEEVKVRVTLDHYHYGKFLAHSTKVGLEWDETAEAFKAEIDRDWKLLRLEAPKRGEEVL